jgi:hypothetical protein
MCISATKSLTRKISQKKKMNPYQNRKTRTSYMSAARLFHAAAVTAMLLSFGCASAPKNATIKNEINQSPVGSVQQAPSGPQEPVAATGMDHEQKRTGSAEQAVPEAVSNADPVPVAKTVGAARQAVPEAMTPTHAQVEIKTDLMESVKSEQTSSGLSEELKGFGEELSSQVRNDLLREIWLAKQELKNSIKDQVKSEVTASVTENLHDLEEQMKDDMHNDTLRELWAVKREFSRFRFSGDMRLRYEKDFFDENNYKQFTKITQGTDTQVLQNTWADQEFYKYRVRFGVETRVNEQLDVFIRLSTGNTSNPVSTNSTMGDYMNKDSVLFDQAYLAWRPWRSITIFGGRMENPWFSTDLVWARDLSFEGLAVNAKTRISETASSFLTVGAFPLQQSDPVSTLDTSQHSKWLYAGQAGLERKDKKGVSVKIGAAYYDFNNITGVFNTNTENPGATDWSAPLFNQKGNHYFFIDATNNRVGLASKFEELNFTGTLDIGLWDPVHIIFLADYVKNLGFNKAEVDQRTGIDTDKSIEGYQIGMSVGYPATVEAGQWKAYFYAKRLGRDAVVDAFTDPDFHLGGTNAKGWIAGADIGLGTNFWLTTRWLTANEISGPPLAIDVLQVDLNAKF